ncbi:MAG TPA: RHS repeat-associated core domain-containing protein, partial [Bryobacteraceae bacterium]|nr:RHS repeat-associated core domain-containing protein [Bryobacteraceae bacterium]
NQLMAIGTTAFQYDGYGRRSQNGAGVSFVYDGLNPVQEIVGGSVRANLVTGGLDEYFGRTDSGGTSSFITDALGSTLALADSTGTVQTQYTFDPFGNTTTTGSSTNVIEYTGRENDGSGMYYYRARYYNAALHRFISEDPLGFGGGEANFYMYTGDSPTNFIDPLGLDKKNLLKCASEFASRYSIAGGLQRFGIGTSGVGGFITNALGGNAVSGLSDLGQSIFTGEGGGHNVFYNMGQGVAAGPTQGFGAAFGKSIKGTPWASGPVDVATDALVKQGFSLATGAGQTIQTLNGVTELGSIGLEVGEFATGFGEVKLAYDVGSYFLGLAKCAAQ